MRNPNIKIEIKKAAIDLFDRHGYHGTSIRNIAQHVGCSLPTVYYYYENKQTLFHEIIAEDYFRLLSRLVSGLEMEGLVDYYATFLKKIVDLPAHEKRVYRLGIKVYLGFDGEEALQKHMRDWEATIVPRHRKIIAPHLAPNAPTDVIVSAFAHMMENLIESIVVREKSYTKEECEAELSILLHPYLI